MRVTTAETFTPRVPYGAVAAHGGPLWERMSCAQIGGLLSATFITLLLVTVIYSICVLDLKIVKWEAAHHES